MRQHTSPKTSFSFVDHIPEGIFIIKKDWRVLAWNNCLEKWSGIKSNEIIGKPIIQYLPHLEKPQYADRLADIFLNGPPVVLSSQLHKNIIPCPLEEGSLRILHTIVTSYKAPDDNETYALFTIQDVTDHTFRINEYNSLHKKLMDEIQQRKEAEIRLLKAKEEAEKANNAKSSFLSQMSHELRTPLNSILGFTQLLRVDSENPLNKQQLENVNKVLSAGDHLLELVNEMLDLAKIESGKIYFKMAPVLVREVLLEVITLSQPAADKNEITINIDGPLQTDIFINADYLRIKQILLNLLSNAIKFNKPKGTVNVLFSSEANGKVKIRVEDTGIGISEENLSRLFDPFERFDAERTSIQGTGIGLTISQKLVKAMNGNIEVKSTLGKGTTFVLEFMTCSDSLLKNLTEKAPNTPSIKSNSDIKKILYIEDIQTNVDLVKQIISNCPGYQLDFSLSPIKGIEMALNNPPDLILMDINMPEMSGLTAFGKLAEKNETKTIPVVALTADAMGPDVKKAMDMGFHSYITKPINVVNFLKSIESILA